MEEDRRERRKRKTKKKMRRGKKNMGEGGKRKEPFAGPFILFYLRLLAPASRHGTHATTWTRFLTLKSLSARLEFRPRGTSSMESRVMNNCMSKLEFKHIFLKQHQV